MTDDDVVQSLHSLSASEKYAYFHRHVKPQEGFTFPTTFTDPDYFPNVSVLLQIACTLPVTSCECERSASALRRLHNYMRASMGTERLSSFALLNVHYDTPVDIDEAVEIFSRLHPRRMELASLIKP